jgi:hypothetical protein
MAADAGLALLRTEIEQRVAFSDPNAAWQGGRMVRHGEIYNDWAGGPGGHAGAARWREEQQRHVREGGRAKVRCAPPAAGEAFATTT